MSQKKKSLHVASKTGQVDSASNEKDENVRFQLLQAGEKNNSVISKVFLKNDPMRRPAARILFHGMLCFYGAFGMKIVQVVWTGIASTFQFSARVKCIESKCLTELIITRYGPQVQDWSIIIIERPCKGIGVIMYLHDGAYN